MLGSKDRKNPGALWPAILAEAVRLKDKVKMNLRKAFLCKPLVSTHHTWAHMQLIPYVQKKKETSETCEAVGGGVNKRKGERPFCLEEPVSNMDISCQAIC